jgi:hypothetical protein
MKSQPSTPSASFSVRVMRAPLAFANFAALIDQRLIGPQALRAAQPDIHADQRSAHHQATTPCCCRYRRESRRRCPTDACA